MKRLGLVLALTVILASGCGSDDEDEGGFSPVVSEPLSKVEFLRQADQICNASEAQIEAAADDLVTQKNPDPEEVARIATSVVVPALKSEIAAIEALGAPEGDEDKVQGILDATQDGIDEIEANPGGLVDAGIPGGLKRAEELARAYGSTQCGIR